MQREKTINATLVEYQCDECGKGVMRITDEKPLLSNPRQWKHACSNCGKESHFTFVLPVIEYKEKNFMLADELRFGEAVIGNNK